MLGTWERRTFRRCVQSVCLVVVFSVLSAGCSDRLNQGDRVILVNNMKDKILKNDQVLVVEIGPYPAGTVNGPSHNSELLSTGTRATVVSDYAILPGETSPGSGEKRVVKILIQDGPFEKSTGMVLRRYLKKE